MTCLDEEFIRCNGRSISGAFCTVIQATGPRLRILGLRADPRVWRTLYPSTAHQLLPLGIQGQLTRTKVALSYLGREHRAFDGHDRQSIIRVREVNTFGQHPGK